MNNLKFGSWSVESSPVTIEYSLAAIEEIRQEVSEGYQRLSRGGIEVGGILYGTHEGNMVRILATRPIACEHALGPGFMLSGNDRAALGRQLENNRTDPRLEGFVCVGFFLSHTRSEVLLNDSDLEIYNAYFAEPWQVALVVRAGRAGSMRAGFFIREAGGSVRTEASHMEFELPTRLAAVVERTARAERSSLERTLEHAPAERTGAQPASAGAAPVAMPSPAPASAAMAPLPGLPPAQSYPPPRFGMPLAVSPLPARRRKWPWLLVWAVAVLAITGAGLWYFAGGLAPEPLSLTVLEREGQLQIQWNPAARPVTSAVRGVLAIVDGQESKEVELVPGELASGRFTYQRKTGDIEIRMSVETRTGSRVVETSRFLGEPPARVNNEELKALEQKRAELEAEIKRLRATNDSQAARIQQLERTLRILQARLGAQ